MFHFPSGSVGASLVLVDETPNAIPLWCNLFSQPHMPMVIIVCDHLNNVDALEQVVAI